MKKTILAGILSIGMLGNIGGVHADSGVVDELWGEPIYSYGGSLDETQRAELLKKLNKDNYQVKEVEVVGQDLITYLGKGDTSARMLSSALISKSGNNSTVVVSIETPENITEITETQYANAVITSGATGVDVRIGSATPVTGHSALVGIYKAFDENGVKLDDDRMAVAQEELNVTSQISKENSETEGFTSDMLVKAVADIKKGLAEENNKGTELTDELVDKIVNDALKENKLDGIITQDQVNKLLGFANQYKDTGAITDKITMDQLNDLAKSVTDNLKNAKDYLGNKITELDEAGFFEKVKEFFGKIFDAIIGFFSSKEK